MSGGITDHEIAKVLTEQCCVSLHERVALGRLAARVRAPESIVEIGTFSGGTADLLRRFAPGVRIISMDPSPNDHAFRVAAESDIELIADASVNVAASFTGTAGLVFIDGSHDLEDALADWSAWAPRAAGRAVAFHDYSPMCPGIRVLADTLVRTGRLAEARCVDSLVFGNVADASAPPRDELEKSMDAAAGWYRAAAEAACGLGRGIEDLTAVLSRGEPPALRIVGRGALGARTAATLGMAADCCVNAADARDPEAFYVIAGTPEREIRESLIGNGIPETNILPARAGEAFALLFDTGHKQPLPGPDRPLSRLLCEKMSAAFVDNPALFERFSRFIRVPLWLAPHNPPLLPPKSVNG